MKVTNIKEAKKKKPDPRITRTAEALYEADRMMNRLEREFKERFKEGA
jgi:hypothetical protein